MPYYSSVRPGDRISDLIMARGQAQAEGSLRAADIWGPTISGIGQQIGGALQERDAARKAGARDAAFVSFLESWDGDPRTALAGSVKILGPQMGAEAAKALVSFGSMSQQIDKTNAEAERKKVGEVLSFYGKQTPEVQARLYPQMLPKLGPALQAFGLPPDSIPAEWSPEVGQTAAQLGAMFLGEKAGEGFTLGEGQIRFGPGGEKIAEGPAKVVEPPKAKTYEVTVPGPDGRPITRLATEEEMRAGVAEYVKPDTERPPVQQRLTKDERQDFASWNYALPKLDAFAAYVQANPGKWGRWDAFAQGLKQQVPGFVDSDYASQQAFIGRLNAEIRHALFGAALTAGEQESAKAFLIDPRDQPETILAKLNEAAGRARSSMGYYRDLGFNIPEAPTVGAKPKRPGIKSIVRE